MFLRLCVPTLAIIGQVLPSFVGGDDDGRVSIADTKSHACRLCFLAAGSVVGFYEGGLFLFLFSFSAAISSPKQTGISTLGYLWPRGIYQI